MVQIHPRPLANLPIRPRMGSVDALSQAMSRVAFQDI